MSSFGTSVFAEMTRQDCEKLIQQYPNLNIKHTVTSRSALTGAPEDENEKLDLAAASTSKMIIQANTAARPFWFTKAAASPNKKWVNLRGSPVNGVLPPANTDWNIANEFATFYLKGFIAASASNSNDFAFVLGANFATSVNGANGYLAGLRKVKPNAQLYLFEVGNNGYGTFSICGVGGKNHAELTMYNIKKKEQELGIHFDVIAHTQSYQQWPPVAQAEGRLLIENHMGVNSAQDIIDSFVGAGKDHVLVTTVFNHNSMLVPVIEKVFSQSSVSGETRFITGGSVMTLSRISSLVAAHAQQEARQLEQKILVKGEKDKFDVLCDSQVTGVLGDAYLVINGCIQITDIAYNTRLSGKMHRITVPNTDTC